MDACDPFYGLSPVLQNIMSSVSKRAAFAVSQKKVPARFNCFSDESASGAAAAVIQGRK